MLAIFKEFLIKFDFEKIGAKAPTDVNLRTAANILEKNKRIITGIIPAVS
jgi:hypothetical protein